MRHGKKFNHLGRKKGHRDALLMNMANSLIEYKRINTTLAKAKALRVYVEPILTKGKDNTTHSRRVVFSDLQNKEAIKELFDVIGAKIADRPGGYCRIIKTGFRKGDGAEMAMIELVDFNDVMKAKTSATKITTRRSRKKTGGESAVSAVAAAAVAAPIVADIVKDEEE
ncbi:MAG: 50S ribosomal protein L17 [Saprospiraceae bacterium]|nr:50S ribosomal protein L17 [Saprospiraceae bacterium]